ncbi:alkylhydroperoxidase domain protein [Leucobacter luti]|uniref:CMD domain protein/alkylhydroperoxidase domain protein n=1 Tax=Leucobacter luti TaxID=340320 RepID=A0A4Q7TZT3_9MICO|nr:alkylhydroperoxidase domain protein [Leucobacter luti]MBL3699103.1 alkylhydroperoxidase domain protein [Leucobacter luti]RZT66605.1 CMD domain protein/alkylhydroperoxidase domain protein [Leucobacter luti]
MSDQSADIIDLLAGITPSSELAAVRAQRTQARENAQLSFTALLEPEQPGDFSLAERYAIAAFVAQLHGFPEAAEFYADLLGDEDSQLAAQIAAAAADVVAAGAGRGPVGAYREPDLASEGTHAAVWRPDADAAERLGAHLAAGLAHAHALVFRPREARPEWLAALVAAGWSADAIVSLSQLVSFLAFQLRLAWGLRVLGGSADAFKPASAAAPASDAAGEVPDPALDSAIDPAPANLPDLVTAYPELARPDRFTQQGLGWVPWLAPVAEAELTATQLDALIQPERAKMPYFRLLARDPAALKARTLTDLDIFFNVTDGIGRAERELAATAASRHNGCVFCASVHSAAATRESGRAETVQRLLDAGVGADLGDPVWNAVVASSVALTDTPLRFGQEDIVRLREVGLGDAEIVDVISGAAFFNWANRLMLSLGEPEVPARRARA